MIEIIKNRIFILVRNRFKLKRLRCLKLIIKDTKNKSSDKQKNYWSLLDGIPAINQ